MARTEALSTARSSVDRNKVIALVVVLAGSAVGMFLLSFATTGPSAERIRNPAPRGTYVYDGVPRGERPLWGIEHWHLILQVLALVIAVGLWAWFVRASVRRRSWHPGLVLCFALTSLVWLDPYSNWVPFAAYDPRLLHWPVTWAWASQSPTVEPLFVIPGYVAAFLPPALGTLWLYQLLIAARAKPGSWPVRHPVASLWLLGWLVGLVWDTGFELVAIHTGFYTYTQVISFGTISPGSTTQFPWLWEVPSVAILYATASALLWRDDRGRTVAARIAERHRALRARPLLATVLVAAVFMNLSFIAYLAFWTGIRVTRVADTVARPWRYEDTKVYDPQGFYEESGEPGPYFPGILSGPRK